ncbi:DNA ligase (NAD(+)) LigA, partial [bacterium]|nr:DNA ligase (NAD(+)) LigA [bacterium]
ATLHNADEIARKDVRVGDTVIIHKAGDIIPEIVQVLPKLRPKAAKKFVMPKECPICKSKVVQIDGGVAHRCSNPKCFPVLREQIIHAVGRQGFDIEGLGDKIVEQLLQEGLIKTPADLWDLTEGDLTPLERFADKSAQNLIQEIGERKTIELQRFIVALGVPNVGTVTAQDLAKEFRTLKKLTKASAEELLSIDGVGEKVADGIVEFFAADDTKLLLKRYGDIGMEVLSGKSGGKLAGKTFVFTGSMEGMTRDEAKQLVLGLGGKVASSVGKDVDYVVVGGDAGSKAKKALQLGLKTIKPTEFSRLVSR